MGEMEFGGVRSCVGNLEGGAWPASASRGLGMSTESDLAAKAAAMLEMGSTAVTDMLAVKKWMNYLSSRLVSQLSVLRSRATENKKRARREWKTARTHRRVSCRVKGCNEEREERARE